jgi:ABC-type glycerol-3-phosphate transport system substrate-binding protein
VTSVTESISKAEEEQGGTVKTAVDQSSRGRGKARSRVVILVVALIVAGVAAVAATGQTKTQKDVTITWMTFETPNLPASFWEDVRTRFEAANPGISVKRLVTPSLDRDGYAKQLLASGQFPDVLQAITPQDYVSQGLLYAFSPAEVASWHVTTPGAGTIGGKQYSIPNEAQVIPLVYYNKSIFAKLHLRIPTTWAQFLAVCKKIKAAGITPLELGGSKDTWGSWIFLGGIFSTDVLGKDPNWIVQRKAGKVHFTDLLVKRAFTKWAALAKAGYFNKDALSLDYPHMQQEFLAGKAAMYPMGSWAASASAVGASKFGTGVFRIPTANGAIVEPDFAAGGVFVSAKSANLAAAKKLAQFWALDKKTDDALATNDAGLMTIKGYEPPSGLPAVYYQTAKLFTQPSTATRKIKRVDVMFFNRGDRASAPGMDTYYAQAAQNILLGKSVDSQLKFLDVQWDKASRK